jgi:hypothetical protein
VPRRPGNATLRRGIDLSSARHASPNDLSGSASKDRVTARISDVPRIAANSVQISELLPCAFGGQN